jgi:hypothetical protein
MKMEKVQITMARVQSNVPEQDGLINLRISQGRCMIVSVDLTPEELANMITNRPATGSAKIYR